MNLIPLGKFLVITGLAIAGLGALLLVSGKFPSWLGHLPGDIHIKGTHVTFYFPVATCLIASVIISLILYFFRGR